MESSHRSVVNRWADQNKEWALWKEWREWLCHTNFSFLIGASHPADYIERALRLGYSGLAITDYDGVYGLARSWRALRTAKNGGGLTEVKAEGIAPEAFERFRLQYGAEIHLQVDHSRPIVLQDTVALIAQNLLGYGNLCRILSYSHRGGKKDANVPLADLLDFDVTGISVIQPMRGLIRTGGGEELRARSQLLREKFSDRLYFAVSRHFNPAEDAWIRETINLGRRVNAKFLLSQDAYFHRPAQKDLSDLLHAVRTNLTMDDAVEHMFVNSERALHPIASLAERFSPIPIWQEALQNSKDLAASCAFDLSELRYHYPKEMIPDGYTAQTYLEKVVWEGARSIYGDGLSAKLTDLLQHEIRLIRELNFADYFLTVWDIVRWARERNILCQGRGSAANSAVCFVLGVTSVDPSLFDVLFERFISVERGDPPDIDVDFEHERREEVIQYIYERYGRQKAAMVANVITFRRKGSIRSVGKALGVPDEMLSKASRTLVSRYFRAAATSETLDALKGSEAANKNDEVDKSVCLDENPDLPEEVDELESDLGADESDDVDDGATALSQVPWKLWGDMAERLKGFPRHLGIHSGGFMLADRPLDTIVAQEPATMEGRSVVQWCKDDIEALGFFKIDILALGMLTATRKCFDMIKEHYGRDLTIATIPADDGPTYSMIQRADTIGTFQIESRAQMSMLPRLRPRNFYDLVIEVAIIRPGPIQGGMIHPYLKRRNGQEPVVFPDERLRPILSRTLGIPIFQEQVMRIAIAVGGFTPGEANELRRHMGAWSIKGDLTPWLQRLATGMRGNGIKEEFIQVILSQMRGFADYGFPESHAASFAIIAYVSCYLKCHYPAAFFSALLNSQPMGFYTPHALLQGAMRSQVKVLPICVFRSDWDNKLENISGPGEPVQLAIRLGMRLIRGMREKTSKALIATRNSKPAWRTLREFLQTVKLYRNDLTALAFSNALAAFGVERRSALWMVEAAPFCPVLEDEEASYAFAPEGNMERVQQDFAATSTSLGGHPAAIIRSEHWCYDAPERKVLRAKDLTAGSNGASVIAFGMILVRQAPPSAKGMVFFTLEDETGFINLAFTPQVYERVFQSVDSQAFLCVSGKLQKQNEGHSIMVRQVYLPRYDRADVVEIGKPADPRRSVRAVSHDELQKVRNYM